MKIVLVVNLLLKWVAGLLVKVVKFALKILKVQDY